MTGPDDLKGLLGNRIIQIEKVDKQAITLAKRNVGLAEKKAISDQNVQMSSARIATKEVILGTNVTKYNRRGDRRIDEM